jgi:hypothetical protein
MTLGQAKSLAIQDYIGVFEKFTSLTPNIIRIPYREPISAIAHRTHIKFGYFMGFKIYLQNHHYGMNKHPKE